MSTENNSTTPGPVPSIDTIRERFAAGMLTVAAMGEQHGSESHHTALATLREAFDQMAALAATPRMEEAPGSSCIAGITTRPQAEEPSGAGWLGPKLPNWDSLNDANPLIQETPVDTTGLVTQCLEGVAFSLSKIGDEFVPRDVGPGLAQVIRAAIGALHAHSRAGREVQS